MKNIADVKSHNDMRKAVVIAYIHNRGYIYKREKGNTTVITKRHRQPIYERS